MQSILTFFVALAMTSSTTACSLNETPAENKAETPPIKQEQGIEEEQSQAEQKIETQQQEKKEPIQKVEQPQKTKVEQQPQEQPKQQQVVDEDGFISWGTVEMPTETDGNEGGLENNWDTVGYKYKDGELEEVIQKVADYCDSLGFEYNADLTQENSSWYPPPATISESPNSVVKRLKLQADDIVRLMGTNAYYKVGLAKEDGIDGYFVFLWHN